MNDFLPTGYEAPVSQGNYFKLKKGANSFRVLGSAVVGYEYWNKENKPVRGKVLWEDVPSDARLNDDGQFNPKHFWAFPVWNYEAKKIQIMEITQKTIMESIKSLTLNPKWGSPTGYDITVTAVGDGLEREYSTMPEPHTQAPNVSAQVNLEALFTGEDPFMPVHNKDVELEPLSEMDFTPKEENSY